MNWISHKLKNQIVIDSPWRYCYIDDFLPEDVFSRLQSDMVQSSSDGNPDLLNHRDYSTFSIDKFICNKILSELRCDINIWGGSLGIPIPVDSRYRGIGVRIDPLMGFDIHPDVPEKIMTGVLYVSPNRPLEGLGTWIYEEGDSDHQEMETCYGVRKIKLDHKIEWIPNRFVTFARRDNTWHSYRNELTDEMRLTFVVNVFKV